MEAPRSSNRRFACACRVPIGSCKNLDHPKKMEWLVGPFTEGWALGKYGAGTLKYGRLVQNYKYNAIHLNREDSEKMRSETMEEVFRSVNYFIEGYFPKSIRPFDSVLPLPSSRQESKTMQHEIASNLSAKGLLNLASTLKVGDGTRLQSKNLAGFSARAENRRKDYFVADSSLLFQANGILFIDDVYDTGATMKVCAELINGIRPDIAKYFLTVAYIK
jgi:predicted amidophosphoribosyltransferase